MRRKQEDAYMRMEAYQPPNNAAPNWPTRVKRKQPKFKKDEVVAVKPQLSFFGRVLLRTGTDYVVEFWDADRGDHFTLKIHEAGLRPLTKRERGGK